jgi:HD-GYP domain-containing protein (c-di-GMP phosphodiesterase class II)
MIKSHNVSLIISQEHLPDTTGLDLFQQSVTVASHAIKILIGGNIDVQALIEAINSGLVYKYLSMPFDDYQLQVTVKRALEAYELRENNEKLFVDLETALTQLRDISIGTIRALADALDAKCDYTSGHSVRVSRLSVAIGRCLGVADEDLKEIEIGGILHDIGKIGVPESILWKPGVLNDDERLIMSHHPVMSAQIVGDLNGMSQARRYVLHHHEFIDGSGYPDHLVGEAIPLGARIILVADAYDAMTTDRPYRKSIGHERALAELRKHAGTQFDPKVVEALAKVAGENGELIKETIPEGVLGLTIAAIDPLQPGKQYLVEAERRLKAPLLSDDAHASA